MKVSPALTGPGFEQTKAEGVPMHRPDLSPATASSAPASAAPRPALVTPADAPTLGDVLRHWQPGTAQLSRRVDPWPAAAFADLIGAVPPRLNPGDPLPPLWHWFYLLDHPAQVGIGADGHPAGGPFLPPIPGRRRMFAGGRLRLDAPIGVGAELSSRSAVADVSVKSGRSGDLAFVTVRHELTADGVLVGTEEQDIVYRSEPEGTPPRAVPQPRTDVPERAGEWRSELATDPVLLFRFSALTYNAHRIHYDRHYATQAEGYPDLVVHGPLLALLALELLRIHVPEQRVRSFAYRLARPAFVPARLMAVGGPAKASAEITVGAQGAEPSLTATATWEGTARSSC
jgi:3-methylfumaryl-CoA hydratase